MKASAFVRPAPMSLEARPDRPDSTAGTGIAQLEFHLVGDRCRMSRSVRIPELVRQLGGRCAKTHSGRRFGEDECIRGASRPIQSYRDLNQPIDASASRLRWIVFPQVIL